MRKKLKNYGFWMSLVSACIIAMQAVGLKFNVAYVNEIITAILGVLVVLGIISNPKEGKYFADKLDDNENNDATDVATNDKKLKETSNDDKTEVEEANDEEQE